jgi:hypothetical protein
LTPAAQVDTRPRQLATMAIDELRRQKVSYRRRMLELVLQRARTHAERISHRAIIGGISDRHRCVLDQLLHRRPDTPFTFLAWLRAAPQSPAARNLLGLIGPILSVHLGGTGSYASATPGCRPAL